ncbi:hypothetical protein PF008_g383 [Phytophthora fragariae]|uniref:Secreted protein n=1 Tax=Phytophthora fragariae TaxID=53985 RepID=A0A6G0SNS8_9STRA|nr:hypothetical protein PF008_g383 [Phytophthora fragariae]
MPSRKMLRSLVFLLLLILRGKIGTMFGTSCRNDGPIYKSVICTSIIGSSSCKGNKKSKIITFVPLQSPVACSTLIVKLTGAPIASLTDVPTTLSLLVFGTSVSSSKSRIEF